MRSIDGAATPNILYVASCMMPAGISLSAYGANTQEALTLLGGMIAENLGE